MAGEHFFGRRPLGQWALPCPARFIKQAQGTIPAFHGILVYGIIIMIIYIGLYRLHNGFGESWHSHTILIEAIKFVRHQYSQVPGKYI